MGDAFTLADCAAAPALFYVNMIVAPIAATHPNVDRYLKRLMERPSYARALKEARALFQHVPEGVTKSGIAPTSSRRNRPSIIHSNQGE